MYGANYYGQGYYGASATTVSAIASVFATVTLVYQILAISAAQTLTMVYNLAANVNGRELYGKKTLYPTLATPADKSDPTQYFDN